MLVATFLLNACALADPSPALVGDASSLAGPAVASPEAPAAPDAVSSLLVGLVPDPQEKAGIRMPPPPPRQRFTVKGGYFDSSEDGLEDGSSIIVSWIRPMSKVLASEVEIGYLDADGTDNGVDRDVWAISFLANARANFDVGQRIELYGGLGLGTFYYDAETKFGPVSASAEGFLFGGDGYFGGSIRLGESVSIGLEGKYYVTDDVSDLGGGLDGFVAMLTVGFDM